MTRAEKRELTELRRIRETYGAHNMTWYQATRLLQLTKAEDEAIRRGADNANP